MKRLFSQSLLTKPRHLSSLAVVATSSIRFFAFLGLTLLAASLSATAERVDGLWDASIEVNGVEVPFRLEISTGGTDASSYFFNGNEKVNPSTRGSFRDGNLHLEFASYATELTASLKDGAFTGAYVAGPGALYPFRAERHHSSSQAEIGSDSPDISGSWEIQVKSPKGESAWRLLVNQSRGIISAAILRVDGDTGVLSGSYKDGGFVLSHFTGERPFYVEITPLPDQTLTVAILSSHDKQTLIALRPEAARLQGLAPPDDPLQHTTLKDPREPLHFAFPDLTGQVVSDRDGRFRGKVLLVNITGSWCPNCHDEAPFLEDLYRKYHAQGLEIVALDFEPSKQLKSLSRAHAFIQRYGIEYVYLIAGEPGQLNEKVPQALNLNAWPTTFLVGRDGRVREIHTGFTSRASGERDSELKAEISSRVEHLLAENSRAGGNQN